MFHVLEHVPDPSSAVRKCRELSKAEGILVVAVPNEISTPKSIVRRWLGELGVRRFRTPHFSGVTKLRCDGSLNEIHLSHFTPVVLRRLLSVNGFATINITLDPYFVFSNGTEETAARARYFCFLAVAKTLGFNLYDTMLAVARPRYR